MMYTYIQDLFTFVLNIYHVSVLYTLRKTLEHDMILFYKNDGKAVLKLLNIFAFQVIKPEYNNT